MNENLSAETFVNVIRHPNNVAVLRIDRPDRNALSTTVLAQIQSAAEELAAEPPGAVVVWGGPELFSAGGDPSEFDHFDPEIGRRVSEAFHRANNALAAIPRATVAAITGVAAGGGLEVALACDFRVAATDARLGQHEIGMGLFPGGGATQRLPRLVGVSRAKELIYSGALVSASEALRIGLVDKFVPAHTVLGAALDWAATFATGAAAVRGSVKRVIDEGLDLSLEDGLRLERDHFSALFDDWHVSGA
ncbi:enoyl-CoA hydratase/isomerase family protein [Streptomyces sp. NPDC006923]|uniref:enoyl-CoA hydratase/isomerase family protein n=1 Tax=Streptomyces sp. NPDC006923 TaxID=3155355 RepID=UPI0033FAF22B